MEAWGVARETALERVGHPALERRADAACELSQAAYHRFMAAPAQTPRGLRLKFEAAIAEDQWRDRADNDRCHEWIMLRAIRADLERLAGEAGA